MKTKVMFSHRDNCCGCLLQALTTLPFPLSRLMTSLRGKSAAVLCTAVLCTGPFKLRQYNNFLSLNTLIKVFVDALGYNISKNQYKSLSTI